VGIERINIGVRLKERNPVRIVVYDRENSFDGVVEGVVDYRMLRSEEKTNAIIQEYLQRKT